MFTIEISIWSVARFIFIVACLAAIYVYVYNIIVENVFEICRYYKSKSCMYIRNEVYEIIWNLLAIAIAVFILLMIYGVVIIRIKS